MSDQPARKVTILLSPAGGSTPHEQILTLLREHGALIAYATRTIAALEPRGSLAVDRLTEIPPELPVVVVWIDGTEAVEKLLPEVRSLVEEGVITVQEAQIDFVAASRPRDLPRSVTVADVMTRDVVTVGPETPIREVVTDLLARDLRAVPVVNLGRLVVGIITNSDLVQRGGISLRLELLRTLDTPRLHERLAAMTAEHRQAHEVMTGDVVTVPETTDIRQAAGVMLTRSLKRLPVLDAEGRLAGMVSRLDLLRAVLPPSAASVGHEEGGEPPEAGRAVRPGSTAGELMSTPVPAVTEEATLSEILNAVTQTRLNRAIVVDAQGRVLGIISDADLVRRFDPDDRPGLLATLMHRVPFVHGSVEADETYHRARARTARDLLHADSFAVRVGDRIGDVLPELLDGRKVIPVVDDRDRVVGIIDRADLLRAMVQL